MQFVVPPSPEWLTQVAALGGEEVQPQAGAVVVFQLTATQAAAVAALKEFSQGVLKQGQSARLVADVGHDLGQEIGLYLGPGLAGWLGDSLAQLLASMGTITSGEKFFISAMVGSIAGAIAGPVR